MPKPLSAIDPSKGLLHIGLRLPIFMYRAHLGWLLGERFLMLTTTGRKTGQLRSTVVEVVYHNKQNDTYYIASGWGDKSDWFRNIQKDPLVRVISGAREFDAEAVRMAPQDSESVFLVYAGLHPYATKYLAKLITGEKSKNFEDQAASLARSIPLIAIKPFTH